MINRILLTLLLPISIIAQSPNYSEDIAPIIYDHCLKCHFSGGIGPINLETYANTVANSGMIQHVTSSGKYLGITFSSPRSTWNPLVPNFLNRYRLGTANTDPNYNIILLKEDSLIVHSEDFLKTDINWFTD